MSGFTTLIERLNESQFQNIVSLSYYIGVKQIVDQLTNEDEDYCQWKLQQFRTGESSNMSDIIEEYMARLKDENAGDSDEEEDDGYWDEDEDEEEEGEDDDEMEEEDHTKGAWPNQNNLHVGDEDFIKRHNLPFSTEHNEKDAIMQEEDMAEVDDSVSEPFDTTNNKHEAHEINRVPADLVFPKDLYDTVIRENTGITKELTDPEKLKLLGENMDRDQMDRFELYRRSKLPKTSVRRLIGIVTRQTVHTSTALYLCAIGKLFLGDVVEKAIHIKKKYLIAHSLKSLSSRKLYGNRILKILKKITKVLENFNGGTTNMKSAKSSTASSSTNQNPSVNSALSDKLQYNLANDDLDYLFNEDNIACDTIFPIEHEQLMLDNDLEEDDYYENCNDLKQRNLKDMLRSLKELLEDNTLITTPSSGKSSSQGASLSGNQFGRLKALVIQYNYWLEKFNELDCNIDKFDDSPLQPEHVQEAWRLYREESATLPPSAYRLQGEGTGWLF